ncbi:MAG: ATP-binding protein [Actinomycetota bacterium]|nr:ATP-binding protein [Actinomycetota bacterium]
MPAEVFHWALTDSFLDRRAELSILEEWWSSDDRMPVNLFGRRRVGKSWLFRRFADGKPAVLLVANRLPAGSQLGKFAEQLEPLLGVLPDLPDVASLFRVLFRAGRNGRLLAVIDEFPWLLPGSAGGNEEVLSTIQAVFEEERDDSQLKLLLCGSLVGQMEALQAERSPLHGRLRPLPLRPLPYHQATEFLAGLDPVRSFERYAIAGGMPRYLADLAGPDLKRELCSKVLDRNGALWDEARTILEQELREPKVYFAILSQLASGDRGLGEITDRARLTGAQSSKYLSVLEDMRIVRRRRPLLAPPEARSGKWHLEDPFFRFWFRFVFPYQEDLESGLRAEDLFDGEVAPVLNDHVAPEFESWCRSWVRSRLGERVSTVGAWWGPALDALRRGKERSSEEIDIVGVGRGRVTVVGEAKWQNKPLDLSVLRELREFKIPALRQAGFTLASDLTTVLMARSGYTDQVRNAAEADPGIILVDVQAALASESTRT